jgi:hypothetical protein
MKNPLHARPWLLGGTIAVAAGLAASAEPLAPVSSDLVLAAYDVPLTEGLAQSALQPMKEAPLRPVPRPLASVPVEVTVQSGAAIRPEPRPVFTAEARWDGTSEGEEWSEAAMLAIEEAPRDLTEIVPADIGAWCPGYERNPPHLRAAFWVGTVSALARYESTFREGAVGGGGSWYGLLQISPATARHYGCEAATGDALRDGEANLECAVRIMSRTVARDGVVAAGGRGIAADWGPMSREETREQMQDWVSDQSYCEVRTAVMASLVPPSRPEGLVPEEPLRVASLD